MRRYARGIEPLIFSIIAICLLAVIGLSMHVDSQDSLFNSTFFKERARVIRILLLFYSLAFEFLAFASVAAMRREGRSLLLRFMRSILGEIRDVSQWLSKKAGFKDAAFWLLAVTALGLTVRGYFLVQPMRYDEAYSFLTFVNRSPSYLFYYPYPSNHVFHSLLVRASVVLFGSHPAAIRLPALLAGVLVIPSTFLFTRLLLKGKGGFVASAITAVFPFMILYDTMARGYSLVVLLSLWLAILGLRFSANPSKATCLLMSLVTALGIFTIPTFIFPATGVILWVGMVLLIRRTGFIYVCRTLVLPFGIMTFLLMGLFYTPAIIVSKGIGTMVFNQAVSDMTWGNFLKGFPLHCLETFAAFIRDVPITVVFIMLISIFFALWGAVKKRDWDIATLLPALGIGAFVPLFLQHNIPFPRTWIFLLPFLFILVDAGCLELGKLIPFRFTSMFRLAFFLVISVWAIVLMHRNIIASYPDTGQFAEAPAVVEILSQKMNIDDKITAACPADATVYFYMWYKKIPWFRRVPLREGTPAAVRQKHFFIVKPSSYSLGYLTDKDVRKILDFGDAEVYVRALSDK